MAIASLENLGQPNISEQDEDILHDEIRSYLWLESQAK